MPGLRDLLGWLTGLASTSDETRYTVDEDRIETLAAAAEGETATPDELAGRAERTAEPPVAYLEADEQPEYVVRGGEVLISGDDETVERKHPSRETRVLVTDERVLIVLGGRMTDTVLGMSHEDVTAAYVDDEGKRPYLVVDGDRDDEPMTFFVDAALDPNTEELRAAAAYLDRRAGRVETKDEEATTSGSGTNA